ncbi:HlyU family transcriptional regulator [Paraburkholderia sp. 22099]|jgi:hypothetical protein|uniref:Transcriptional regulator n=1 Tax=Paraburkholderia terricola TaxID=169427 RepID=A0ABU1LKG2_9BURK|nr:HlyU family transcriptional regulator [Paraburkholderia terricola]MDR6407241.1 hypothetical protein [Paraburkholderia terricola]MDR6445221.1 hypothetical protein [Paraburkholderia terricola]MDR6479081.1 hypothetical protein [Paraburkholderia terricola]
MEFDYKDFHIDATPLSEGGHYFARAKLLRRSADGTQLVEQKWSGDLGQFPSERDAMEYARRWAIEWVDENG